jgi:hypothetical protein
LNLALGLARGESFPETTLALGALVVGMLGYGLSIVLAVRGAQQLGAARAQSLFAAAPFLGAALSWTLLAEPVDSIQLAAAGVVVVGLVLLFSARHSHRHVHEAVTHTHAHRHDDGHHTHVHPDLPPWTRHTHEHVHECVVHAHAHDPDLHHRHTHTGGDPG